MKSSSPPSPTCCESIPSSHPRRELSPIVPELDAPCGPADLPVLHLPSIAVHLHPILAPTAASRLTTRRSRSTWPEPYQLEALQELLKRTPTLSVEEQGALALEINLRKATTVQPANRLSRDLDIRPRLSACPDMRISGGRRAGRLHVSK